MERAIIIPCYNESQRLDLDSFHNFISQRDSYSICFVNDGSTDDTLEILRDFQSKHKGKVHIFNSTTNVGKAEAIRSGINFMLSHSRSSNIGFMDADLATGFDDYENLVRNLENDNYSMVIGSRMRNSNDNIKRTKARAYISLLFNRIIQSIIGLEVNDTQCGAKVFKRNSAQSLFKTKFSSKWLFDIEIFMRLRNTIGKDQLVKNVSEITLEKWEEIEGSKINLRDVIKMPIQLLKIIFHYNFRPLFTKSNKGQDKQAESIVNLFFMS